MKKVLIQIPETKNNRILEVLQYLKQGEIENASKASSITMKNKYIIGINKTVECTSQEIGFLKLVIGIYALNIKNWYVAQKSFGASTVFFEWGTPNFFQSRLLTAYTKFKMENKKEFQEYMRSINNDFDLVEAETKYEFINGGSNSRSKNFESVKALMNTIMSKERFNEIEIPEGFIAINLE